MPGEDAPDWIETEDALKELAKSLGIDPTGLEDTVSSYNRNAKHDEDPEFLYSERGRFRSRSVIDPEPANDPTTTRFVLCNPENTSASPTSVV